MKKSLKIGLLIAGVFTVGAVTVLSIRSIRKKQERKRLEEEERRINKELVEELSGDLQSTYTPAGGSNNCVIPKRNLNRDINNNFESIKGVTLYPAQKSQNPEKGHNEGLGYSIIRSSPEVNNKDSWYDVITNEIGKISSGTPIGQVISERYDNQDPAHRWFGVKLVKPMNVCSPFGGTCVDTKYGWVRADVVTFQKYCK